MESSGNQSQPSAKNPRELDRLKGLTKRMIKLTNHTAFPYDAASYDQCRWTYPTIIENYKDKTHIPPLELVYAGIKKAITNIKKDSFCVRCAMKVGENGSRGLYFPLDKGIYLIPIPCCEGCFGRVQTVLVNGQICPIRHYTWKMIVCANLAEHYHQKVVKEITPQENIIDPVIENIIDPATENLFMAYDFDNVTMETQATLEDSHPYTFVDLPEHEVVFESYSKNMAETHSKRIIGLEFILSSIFGPVACYLIYYLYNLFMNQFM